MKNLLPHIKILLLENTTTDLLWNALKCHKNERNFEIVTTNSKCKFSEALEEHHPDVIICEDTYNGCDYKEMLRILNSIKTKVPLILLTDNQSAAFGIKMFKNGVYDYISKNSKNLAFFIEKSILKFNAEQEKLESKTNSADERDKFKGLIEANSDVVSILSTEGEIKFITSSIKDVLGVSKEEVNNRKMIDLLNLDNPLVFTNALSYAISNPLKNIDPILISTQNVKRELIWLQITFINQLDDPTVKGIVVWLKDVTKEKVSEIKNLDKEKKYRAFFENSLDGILLTNVDGSIYAANPAACKMFQMTENEICEKGRSGLVDHNDPRLYIALEERERTGKTACEINMFRKDGSSFVAEFSSVLIEPNKGFTSMIIKDNTEKHRIKNELQKSEERYKLLFKYNPLPTFMFNETSLKIVDVNDSCFENYGYSRDELLKMNFSDLNNVKDNEQLHDILQDLKRS